MNRLTLIFAVCVAIAVALFMFHDEGVIVDRDRAGEAFLPELSTQVNDAGFLLVEKGDERIELERRGDDWVVATKGGYPAKFEAIRGLLVSLARLVDAQPRTNRPDRFSELMLDESGDTAGTHVIVKDQGDKVLADVVVGKSRWQPSQAVYLRHAGENQAYLLEGNVRAQPQPTTWMDMNIVQWGEHDVVSLVIEGEINARLGRDEVNAITIEQGLPEGRVAKTPGPFAGLFGVLSRLDFADVKPTAELSGTLTRSLTFGTIDGGAIVLNLFKDDAEKVWVRLEARPSEQASPKSDTVAGPPAPEDAGDHPEAKITPDQADTWNAAWSPWAFEMPTYRTSTLLATWDDWLEPLPEPESQPVAQPSVIVQPGD